MKCPDCGSTMKETDRQGIALLRCPACTGLWLDEGTLQEIVDRAISFNPEIEERSTETRFEIEKPRKSFLARLFGF